MLTEEIKVTKTISNGGSVEYKEEHPAFGQVSLSRKSGNPGKLYGSNLDTNEMFITLTIKRSCLYHDLSRDWFFSKDPIIEIDLSAAQFAELLTTMNINSGVPCTLRHINKERIPWIPDSSQTESERIEESFNDSIKYIVVKLKEYENKVAEILEKKTLGKKDRITIKSLFYTVRKFFIDQAPFAAKSLVEAKEKVVTSAKTEIDAFMTHAITNAGLKHLRSTNVLGQEDVKLLEEKQNV